MAKIWHGTVQIERREYRRQGGEEGDGGIDGDLCPLFRLRPRTNAMHGPTAECGLDANQTAGVSVIHNRSRLFSRLTLFCISVVPHAVISRCDYEGARRTARTVRRTARCVSCAVSRVFQGFSRWQGRGGPMGKHTTAEASTPPSCPVQQHRQRPSRTILPRMTM